jgi:very-short-patch-repair endonuclease
MRGVTLAFDVQCRAVGLPVPVAEFTFHQVRKWRIDWAWPDQKVALEVEGGVFIQGRHSRGAGMLKDFEKYNALAAAGWRLIRVTPSQVRSGAALAAVEAALKAVA